MMRTEIEITGEPSTDPTVCRFHVSEQIYTAGSHRCLDAEAARGSELLERLFSISGVQQVEISGNVVTVLKSGPEPWQILGKEIGVAIRAHLVAGSPFIPPPPRSTYGKLSAEEATTEIRALLERDINPALAAHGGKVELVELRGESVLLKMSGGCQGCGAAKITMKTGIEKAIKTRFPQITDIVDVTDHAAGETPYY
jgi:Fe-S cluster biogenesis protein NfuA